YWSQLDLPLLRMGLPAGEMETAPDWVGLPSLPLSHPPSVPFHSSQPENSPVPLRTTLQASPNANVGALQRLSEGTRTTKAMLGQSGHETPELSPIRQLLPTSQVMRTRSGMMYTLSDRAKTVIESVKPDVKDTNKQSITEATRHSALTASSSG